MEKNIIYQGDSIESIKKLPDESVDCVVTSPPYYGLRDYGTGEWVGGDPNCKHEEARKKTRFDYAIDEKQASSKETDVKFYEKVCPTCGAVRVDKQIGLEETPEQYIQKLVELFREIRRVLKKDGTIWVNLGDSYAGNCSRTSTGRADMGKDREGVFTKGGGLASKQLMGIPWRFAFAMQEDGWYLRQDIIWHKPNPMPESVTDRCTKSHEYIFLLSKSEKYYFDYEAIQEDAVTVENRPSAIVRAREFDYNTKRKNHPEAYLSKPSTKDRKASNSTQMNDGQYATRNKRDVWSVCVKPNMEAHFATYPEELIAPCILAGCRENGIVLDPFMGSGTTGIVARKLNRNYIGCELNQDYVKMAERRIAEHGENLFNQ